MITLYHSVASRAFVALWMLEELGVPFQIVDTDIRTRKNKAPDYLKINPMGKVPALDDGGVIVTENPAICLYLADKYGYGALSPKIEDPARGPFLKWMVFSTAVFESAIHIFTAKDSREASGVGWGSRDEVVALLDATLTAGPYLMGEGFSAADVALGGLLTIAMHNKRVPEVPSLVAYNVRLQDRPAYKRAGERTWPPDLFKS